ncbi:MAG: hypothetical protein KF722_14120, partial [Nitrospira sp.]|nr:hypothetical protein [Nitrospira sp.]
KVSIVGTEAFIDFIESIKIEGVDLEYDEMHERSRPRSPMVVEVERDNQKKDIERLDIELPILAPRIYREYKNLEDLNIEELRQPKLQLKSFTEEEQREIVFKDIDADEVSHTTILDSSFSPDYHSVIGYFSKIIMRDLRLVGGFDILFGKVKRFVEAKLFDRHVDLEDLNVLRNLSEIEATRAILETFKAAVNALTVQDKGTTEVRDRIKFSKTRPFIVTHQEYLSPKRSIFSKIVGDSHFELEFAGLLDESRDVVSFVKNSPSTHFKIEYRTADGSIGNYYPDFVVKETEADYWIVETKGREDLDDAQKWERLKQWCEDASKAEPTRRFHPLIVRQEIFDKYHPKTFLEASRVCRDLAA